MFARTDVTLHLLHHEHTGKNKAGQFMLLGCAERLTTRREKDVLASMLCECVYYKRLRIFGTYTMRRTYVPNDPTLTLHIPQTPLAADKVRTLFIVFRGTHTMADFVTDFRILGGNYHASDLALDNLRTTKDEVGKAVAALGLKPNVHVCLTGHSLGGAYAVYQLRKLPPCTACDLILYNPAVTKPLVRLFATYVKKLALRGYLYRTESDIISYQYSMFAHQPAMRIRTLTDHVGDKPVSVMAFMLHSHKMPQFVAFDHVRDPKATAASMAAAQRRKLRRVQATTAAATVTAAGVAAGVSTGVVQLRATRKRRPVSTKAKASTTRKTPGNK